MQIIISLVLKRIDVFDLFKAGHCVSNACFK